jgi:exodeoxyribonuclease III
MGFRLVTLNLNGIRSAATKGFMEWTASIAPDCMGVQELKAQPDVIEGTFDEVAGMVGHFHCAQKKGYSGVGAYSRHTPSAVITGLGLPVFDDEGRYLELRFDQPGRLFSVISCYFPSGSSGDERQQVKFRFLEAVFPHLMALKAAGREFILVGDINIAHQAIDLKNWRSNQKNSGFLPEERAWMTRLLTEGGLVDVYRSLHPQTTDTCYTWWSNRGQAWAKNVGWRLDYHLATPAVAALARSASIHKDQRFSDHAPLTIDYDFSL